MVGGDAEFDRGADAGIAQALLKVDTDECAVHALVDNGLVQQGLGLRLDEKARVSGWNRLSVRAER